MQWTFAKGQYVGEKPRHNQSCKAGKEPKKDDLAPSGLFAPPAFAEPHPPQQAHHYSALDEIVSADQHHNVVEGRGMARELIEEMDDPSIEWIHGVSFRASAEVFPLERAEVSRAIFHKAIRRTQRRR